MHGRREGRQISVLPTHDPNLQHGGGRRATRWRARTTAARAGRGKQEEWRRRRRRRKGSRRRCPLALLTSRSRSVSTLPHHGPPRWRGPRTEARARKPLRRRGPYPGERTSSSPQATPRRARIFPAARGTARPPSCVWGRKRMAGGGEEKGARSRRGRGWGAS